MPTRAGAASSPPTPFMNGKRSPKPNSWPISRQNRRPNFPGPSRAADGACLVFAGLWEGWRGPDGAVIRSFTIVTTSANETLQPLHERMPVVLEEADWPLWLGETGTIRAD